MKRPAFQFYPADWRKDLALSSCSLSARGLWIELMCVAHESDEYGVLSVNRKPLTTQQLARTVGESPAVIGKLLEELEQAGVFSRNEAGAIFSRRMVKDEHLRNVRASAGRLGGNPNLLNQKDKQTNKQPGKQSPTPSSSSSSSNPTTLPTRAGALCKRLREIGIEAAPHQQQLLDLLDKHTDEQILAVAEIAAKKKQGERITVAYLVPILADAGKPAKARTPKPENFEQRDYGEGITAL